MSKQTKYTKSAQGQCCQARIPNVCNHDPSKVVLAHLNGGGTGTKHIDIHGCYACSDCHTWLDGGYANAGYSRQERDLYHLEAMVRTQAIMVRDGVLKL